MEFFVVWKIFILTISIVQTGLNNHEEHVTKKKKKKLYVTFAVFFFQKKRKSNRPRREETWASTWTSRWRSQRGWVLKDILFVVMCMDKREYGFALIVRITDNFILFRQSNPWSCSKIKKYIKVSVISFSLQMHIKGFVIMNKVPACCS